MNSSVPHLATLSEASFLDFWSYGLIAVAANLLYHLKTKHLIYGIAGIAFALIATVCIDGGFFPNAFKYPLALQYVLWGLLVVSSSFLLTRLYPIRKLPAFLVFISANSMWVYFWHLIPVNFIAHYRSVCPQLLVESWWMKWISIVLFATSMTYIQNMIVIYLKRIKHKVLSYARN